jgi:hypothetical protein
VSRSKEGTRMIKGREYLLAGRHNVFFPEDREYVARQVEELRKAWALVTTRTRYGFDCTLWVHGSKR